MVDYYQQQPSPGLPPGFGRSERERQEGAGGLGQGYGNLSPPKSGGGGGGGSSGGSSGNVTTQPATTLQIDPSNVIEPTKISSPSTITLSSIYRGIKNIFNKPVEPVESTSISTSGRTHVPGISVTDAYDISQVPSPYERTSYKPDTIQPTGGNEIVIYIDKSGLTTGKTSAGIEVQKGINPNLIYESGGKTATGQEFIDEYVKQPTEMYTYSGETKILPVEPSYSYATLPTYVSAPSIGGGTISITPTTQLVTPPPKDIGIVDFSRFVSGTPSVVGGAVTKGLSFIPDITTTTPPVFGYQESGTSFYDPSKGFVIPKTSPTEIRLTPATTDITGVVTEGTLEEYSPYTSTVSFSKGIGKVAEFGTYVAAYPVFIGASAVSGGARLLSPKTTTQIMQEANIEKYNLKDLPYGITLEEAKKFNEDIDKYVSDVKKGERIQGIMEVAPLAVYGLAKGIGAIRGSYVAKQTGLTTKELARLKATAPGSQAYYDLMFKAKSNIQRTYEKKFGMIGNATQEKIAFQKIKALDLAFPSGRPLVPASDYSSMYKLTPYITKKVGRVSRVEVFPATAREISLRQGFQGYYVKNFPTYFRDSLKISPFKTIGSGKETLSEEAIKRQVLMMGGKEGLTATKQFKLPKIIEQSTVSARQVQFRRAPIPIYGMTESGKLVPTSYLQRMPGFGLGPKITEINILGSTKQYGITRTFGASAQLSAYTGKLIQQKAILSIGKKKTTDIFIFKPAIGRPMIRRVGVEGMPDIIVTKQPALKIEGLQRAKVLKSTEKEISPGLFTREYFIKYSNLPSKTPKTTGITEYEFMKLLGAKKYSFSKIKGTEIGREVTRDVLNFGKVYPEITKKATPITVGKFEGIDYFVSGKFKKPYTIYGNTIPYFKPATTDITGVVTKTKPSTPFTFEVIPTAPSSITKQVSQILKSPPTITPQIVRTSPPTITSTIQTSQSLFYGKGTYEKTAGGLLVGTLGAFALMPRVKASQSFLQEQRTKLEQPTVTKLITPQAMLLTQIQVPTTIQPQPQQTGQVPIQIPIIIPIEIPKVTPTPTPPPYTPPPYTPPRQPTPPRIPIGIPYEEFAWRDTKKRKIVMQRKPQNFFVPEIRRYGKFRPLGKFATPERAIAFGKERVRGGLGATFRIRTPKGGFLSIAPSEEFRRGKTPFALVQRKTTRVTSRGEKAEFKATRRTKINMKKMWGFK